MMQQCNGQCTKKEVSIKDFFSKCDQILSFLRIWSHLPKKFLMKNFIFCAITTNLELCQISKVQLFWLMASN